MHNEREIKRHLDQIQSAEYSAPQIENDTPTLVDSIDLADSADINDTRIADMNTEPLPSTSAESEPKGNENIEKRSLRPRAGGKAIKLKELRVTLPRFTEFD